MKPEGTISLLHQCHACNVWQTIDRFQTSKAHGGPIGKCRACRTVDSRNYAAANPDKVRAAKRRWVRENPEQMAAARKAWQEANVERARQAAAEWRARNAERTAENKRRWRLADAQRHRDYANKRRARLMSEACEITARDRRRLDAMPCLVCGTTDNLTDEHLIPISRGGRHAIGNLARLCAFHNKSKGARTWIEYRAYLSRKAA